jgi:hypothetical protein
MSKVQPGECRDDVREMIPWYVNGTLSRAEALVVCEHIEGCDDCSADVELHTRISAAAAKNDVTPILPKTSAADVLGDDEAGQFRPSPSGGITWRRMAVAASFAILLAVLLVDRLTDNTNQRYETATSAESVSNIDYVLQLRFDEDISEQHRGEIVLQLDDVVKWTTLSSGDYEIHVRLTAPSLQALERYQERAESIPGVQSAEFTALQLPMR